MAADQLSLYNDALLLLGQRQLASLSENREPRFRLDDIYGIEALEFCLEVSKPLFARETNTLTGSSASAEHGLDNVFALPSDYLSMVSVFSDDKLDQPLNRYIIENRTIACEFSTIYIRFVSSALVATFASWTPSFTKVVSAYLARELAERISPEKYPGMDAKFAERVQIVLAEAAQKELAKRPTSTAFTITADYLNVYNDAFILLGLDEIATINDDSDRRTKLDRVILNGAVDYCLEVTKPTFAKKTIVLNTPTTSPFHGLDSVHTLPSDYVSVVQPYSDDKLDQEVGRYLIEGNTLICEYDTIFFRYVSDAAATSLWSPSFKRVLAAYLAREASVALNPEAFETINEELQLRIGAALALEAGKEPGKRPSASLITMTASWRKIFNDALLIMGLDEINENDDDSNRRAKLDRALDADLVESVLEDTGWHFGLTSTKSQFNPSIEPEFGYQRGHNHPTNLLVLYGIYSDEYMRDPHKLYQDEGEIFFTDLDDLYIQYVDIDFIANPGNWPAYFRKLIAARMAKDAANSLKGEGADAVYSDKEYEKRLRKAMSADVMNAPPRILAPGNWTTARQRTGSRGDRSGRA